MTPKEKAEKLVLGFIHVPDEAMKEDSNAAWLDARLAKRCALITVDEIIESRKGDKGFDDTHWVGTAYHKPHPCHLSYWVQVKQEIESL